MEKVFCSVPVSRRIGRIKNHLAQFMTVPLDHTPNDIWAIHSIAHIKEETQR